MKWKTCAIRCGAVASEVVCELQLGKLDSSVDVQRHLREIVILIVLVRRLLIGMSMIRSG